MSSFHNHATINCSSLPSFFFLLVFFHCSIKRKDVYLTYGSKEMGYTLFHWFLESSVTCLKSVGWHFLPGFHPISIKDLKSNHPFSYCITLSRLYHAWTDEMFNILQSLSQLASINHDVLLQSGKSSSKCSSPSQGMEQ